MQESISLKNNKNVFTLSHVTCINIQALISWLIAASHEAKDKKRNIGESPIGNAYANGQILILEKLIIGLQEALKETEESTKMEKVKNLIESVVKLDDIQFRRADTGLAAALDNALSRLKQPGDAVILTIDNDKDKRTLDLRLGKLRKAKKIDDRIRLRKTSEGKYCIAFFN